MAMAYFWLTRSLVSVSFCDSGLRDKTSLHFRWYNHLDPTIRKDSWGEEEEAILTYYRQIYGNKWTKLAELLPGRYVFNKLLRKRLLHILTVNAICYVNWTRDTGVVHG